VKCLSVVVLSVVLLLTGCALVSPPKSEPVRALLNKVPDNLPSERQHNITLLVLPPETSEAYDTTRMAYSIRRYEIGYFRDNEWAEPPAQMLEDLLLSTLRETGYFKAVLASQGAERPTYQLRTTILELLQDHTVSPPVLRLALRIQLLGWGDNLIAERDIRRVQALERPTPYSGVVAANNATALALREVAQFVVGTARKPGAHSRSIF